MKIARLIIKNFRGISSAELFFPNNVVLIGDNNIGKSTIFEAFNLTLCPDRINRRPVIDEHDFYYGKYLSKEESIASPKIEIEATITDLRIDQQSHFKDYIEWWLRDENTFHTTLPVKSGLGVLNRKNKQLK